jgi:flagellar L-ring protein precursor FlgH
MRSIALLALAASATGCASVASVGHAQITHDALAAPGAVYNAARHAMAPPQLEPVSNPAVLTGGQQQTMPQPISTSEPPRANSLWRTGSRSFFNDQRASRIGDILTVNIEIDDSASLSNSSNRTRTGSTTAGVNHFFGLEGALGRVLPSGFDPTQMIDTNSTSAATGAGAIDRKEKIRLTVAAVVVDRLPNGNLVIAGRQDVNINAEMRQLTVSGVIRPEDISAENTINHTQIAEARISYGGQGQISAVQRPGWGQRIIDAVSPW